jgi:hypothetical protein
MASSARLKRNYKIWFYQFLLFNIVILFLTAIANPYRLAPFQITIPGLNDIKPRLYDYQRYIKLFDIAYQKPQTILLGSSRVLWGLDPKNPVLQTYQPVYNAGVTGPPLYEIREYFHHALVNQPQLKRVVLALDFYAFNGKFDNRDLVLKNSFGKTKKEIVRQNINLLLDFPAMAETIFDSMRRKKIKTLREDGKLTPDPLAARELYTDFFPPEIAAQPAPVANSVAVVKTPAVPVVAHHKKKSAIIAANGVKKPSMKNELYLPFNMSNQSLSALQEIIATCKERGIELYIYIPPTLNNVEADAFHQMSIWKNYADFQRQLAKLHPFWDFAEWNEITQNKDNFIDGSHHVFPVGDMILGRMFGKPTDKTPASFGKYVTAVNVDAHLRAVDHDYYSRQKA